MWNFLPKALSFYADERLPLAKQHSGGGSDFLVSEHERKEAHQAPTHPSFLTDQTKPSDSHSPRFRKGETIAHAGTGEGGQYLTAMLSIIRECSLVLPNAVRSSPS